MKCSECNGSGRSRMDRRDACADCNGTGSKILTQHEAIKAREEMNAAGISNTTLKRVAWGFQVATIQGGN